MKTVRIKPVRNQSWRNHWLSWPRKKQVLASILLWATRSEATKVDFSPEFTEGFRYSNPSHPAIVTELGPPPAELIQSFPKFLQDIVGGGFLSHWIRPSSKASHQSPTTTLVEIPDLELNCTHQWELTLDGNFASFHLISGPNKN